ncbi:MAG: L-histidine N(alpha)-methyltransferase [Acidobacteriota bacterium]
MNAVTTRLTWIEDKTEATDGFVRDVREGLAARPKIIPCRYFYDSEGSSLFEQITALPEYYPTRTERWILEQCAEELASLFKGPISLVELGSGSAAKTRLLIDAVLRRQETMVYVPIDVSKEMLERSSMALLEDYPDLQVSAVAAEYEHGLARIREAAGGPRLVLWLGSSVGNLDRRDAVAFLAGVAQTMGPEDRLLIGMDLHKARSILEPAYDDALGVTAAFNLNLLARINRELGGQFELSRFRHRSVYNEDLRRIEMYLVSSTAQQVRIDHLDMEISFEAGEAIHTENSHKYTRADIRSMLWKSGFALERQYLDPQRLFSLNLAAPLPSS